MWFTRTYHVWGRNGESYDRVEAFNQPVRDRAVYLAFHALWLAEWKIKPVGWLFNLYDQKVMKPRHEKTCKQDCVTFDGDYRMCARMPLSNMLDCKLYDLDHKNNTPL